MRTTLSGWFFIVLICAGMASASQNAPFALRVNAGESAETRDKAANSWQPDRSYAPGSGYGFQGGTAVNRGSIEIQGTENPGIYRTEHYGMTAFIAEVPDGLYTVRLHFAETFARIEARGPRIFDLKIQGTEVSSGLDVMKAAGGLSRALIKEFKGIEVKGGKLQIDFVPHQQNPMINGIEILAQ